MRSEMVHLHRMTGVQVLFQRFTCGLTGELLDLDEVHFSKAMTRADGGTEFNEVIELAHKVKPDVLLIATDGRAPTPNNKPPCPMAWILTNGGQTHPWGMIIRLPTIDDIRNGYKAVVERWAPR